MQDKGADLNTQVPLQVEEVSPEIEHPEEIAGSIPPDYPTDIPVYEEKTSKVGFIIGIIVVFLVIFGLFFWFFLKDRLFPQNLEPSPKSNVTLTYWGLWEEEEVYQPLIDAYQKANPHVKITYEKMAPQKYRERLLARSLANNGPDIFRFHNTWLPQLQEIVAPLPQGIYTNAQFESTFYPIHANDLKITDSYYGIPLMIDGSVLIYNDTLLKQAGIQSAPAVWVGDSNDVFSAVSKLTVRDPEGTVITSGMAIGTATNVSHFGELFSILLLLNGGDFKKLNAPEAVEALQLYRKFAEDGYWNEQMPNSITSFIQGKTAMIIAPSWTVLAIKAQNPELAVKIAPVPKGLDNASAAIAHYWVEGVNRLNPNQDEAWKFLKYLSEKEQLSTMYELQSRVRPFGSAFPRKDMADLAKSNPYLEAVISQAVGDAYVSLPVADRTYDEGMNDEILKYLENAISATAEGVDYAAALSTAQQGVSKVLERFAVQ